MGSEGTAFLLRQADSLVKDGKYEAALKLIRAVRAQDPQNPYAKAYEDRIRALVLSTNSRGSGRGNPAPNRQPDIPSTNTGDGSAMSDAQNPDTARKLRIRNYVRLARTFLAAGRKEEALNELAFASMIDPRDDEVIDLEEEIRHEGGEMGAEFESTIISAPEEVVPIEDPPSEIRQPEEVAEPVPAEPGFLEEQAVTPPAEESTEEVEPVVVQPVDQDSAALEKIADVIEPERPVEAISTANVDYELVADEAPPADVENLEPQGEVPEQVVSSELVADVMPELPVPQVELTEAAAQQSEMNDQQSADNEIESGRVVLVRRQSERAMKLLMSGAFDEALAEVALGLVQDPGNAELHALEGKIWRAKDAIPGDQGENRYQRDHLVQLHLLAAEEFRKKNEFTRALDEIAKAYALDPENKEIQQTDARIRQGETRQNNNDGKILKLIYPNTRAAGGSA